MKRDDANQMDCHDPLKSVRQQFILSPEMIYLSGHSLGAMPKAAMNFIQEMAIKPWEKLGACAWEDMDWMNLSRKVGTRISALLGAKVNEIAVTDNVTVNLYKLIKAGMSLNPGRHKILTDKENFPTDIYVAQGTVAKNHMITVNPDEIENRLDEDINLLLLTHVNYKTGRTYDMENITHQAHQMGIHVLWDLSHTVGIHPVDLQKINADFAVGCGYKYLNGGPGCPAYLYVAERHQQTVLSPIRGWMGHQNPFEFSMDYIPAKDANRFLSGTPAILSMSVFACALEIYTGLDIEVIRHKSKKLGEMMITLMERVCPEMKLLSPKDSSCRGGHVAFMHPEAANINRALKSAGVIADYRQPNCIRFGLSPLYTQYVDVFDAVQIIGRVVAERSQYA